MGYDDYKELTGQKHEDDKPFRQLYPNSPYATIDEDDWTSSEEEDTPSAVRVSGPAEWGGEATYFHGNPSHRAGVAHNGGDDRTASSIAGGRSGLSIPPPLPYRPPIPTHELEPEPDPLGGLPLQIGNAPQE